MCSSVRRESNSGVYFAGMFRVANAEFIPEYRQEESHEFVSMATKIQHVVCVDVIYSRHGKGFPFIDDAFLV